MITSILLILATFAFILRFWASEKWIILCDIASFSLPTVAAFVEMILADKVGKKTSVLLEELEEKSHNAVYFGECYGEVTYPADDRIQYNSNSSDITKESF